MRPGKNLVLGIPLMVIVFAVSATVLFGFAQLVKTDDSAQASAEEEEFVPGGPVNVTVVAKDSRFDRRTITASPGASVTVTLDNQDTALHNIAFYPNRTSTQVIAASALFTGPGTDVLTFTAPPSPGSYFFKCDAHPDVMTGTFAVR